MNREEYDKVRDKLAVKKWLLDLAESRNMGYEDEGDGVILTFNDNYLVPQPTIKQPPERIDDNAAEESAPKHSKNRPKKSS